MAEDKNGGKKLNKLIQSTFCAFVPISLLLRLYFHPPPYYPTPPSRKLNCDYAYGAWVSHASYNPLYNATTCGTIKPAQNCISHGRPDSNFLKYKWVPRDCSLPPFSPSAFLSLLQNTHIAFVGDSISRNQLESLLCMASSGSLPTLLYSKGEDNRFRRWIFYDYNLTLSLYWSPFLVKGIEKDSSHDYNRLYLDVADQTWTADAHRFNVLVLSVGHWFLHPAVYYERGLPIGCHYCPGMNHTEIEFFGPYSTALGTALRSIKSHGAYTVLTTYSPAHFEGAWDNLGACNRTEPENGRVPEGMDEEMRTIAWRVAAREGFVDVLDVTRLSLMRPDGHPGPYMNPYPFAGGVGKRVQNDCVHWCLPGPVDTWNEILFEKMRQRWNRPTQD